MTACSVLSGRRGGVAACVLFRRPPSTDATTRDSRANTDAALRHGTERMIQSLYHGCHRVIAIVRAGFDRLRPAGRAETPFEITCETGAGRRQTFRDYGRIGGVVALFLVGGRAVANVGADLAREALGYDGVVWTFTATVAAAALALARRRVRHADARTFGCCDAHM